MTNAFGTRCNLLLRPWYRSLVPVLVRSWSLVPVPGPSPWSWSRVPLLVPSPSPWSLVPVPVPGPCFQSLVVEPVPKHSHGLRVCLLYTSPSPRDS